MTDTHPEFTLSDVTWLTALARSLTRDGAEADDLVQETWIAATASPPTDGAVNRAWLARVLRNFHLKSLRSQDRRSRREQVASRAESQPSSADLVEAAELRRNLADGLLALPEPYRTTLMRVAFEGQTARQIAEVEGVSVGVVRHRLRQARELYKQELDRRCEGEGSRWYAALLPFADLPLPGDAATAGAAGGVTTAAAAGGLLVSIQTLIAVGAAAFVGLFLWLLQEPSEGEARPPEALAAGGPILETPAVAGGPSVAADPPVREAAPEEPLAAMATEEEEESADDADLVWVTGELIYRDELGVLLPPPTQGTFFLDSLAVHSVIPVRVQDGEFRYGLPKGKTLTPQRPASLDRRAAEMLGFGQTLGPITEDTVVQLEARRLPAFQVEVRDKDTLAELDDLTFLRQSPLDSHPGNRTSNGPVIEHGLSPVSLTLVDPQRSGFFVSAPGYPWTEFELDPYAEGIRTVLLEAGCAELEVIVEGLDAAPCELVLWSWEPSLNATTFTVGPDGRVLVDRLKPGEYELQAISGELEANLKLVVEPGASSVTLQLEALASETKPLVGTLSLPRAWNLEEFTLKLLAGPQIFDLPSSELQRDEVDPQRWYFSIPEATPGRYMALIDELVWFTLFQFDGDPIWLEIGAPESFQLRLLDSTTGEPLDPQTPDLDVSWAHLHQGAPMRRTRLDYDPDTLSWPVQAPVGSVGLFANSPVLDGRLEFDLAPGADIVEVWTHPTGDLVIDLFDQGVEIQPADYAWATYTQLTADDGTPGKILEFRPVSNETVMQIDQPGLYTLELRDVVGYKPIGDLQVEIEAGEMLRLRVDLERE